MTTEKHWWVASRGDPYRVSHQTSQVLLASLCPSGPGTPRLRSRECAQSHTARRSWSWDITQFCLPLGWGSVSKLPGQLGRSSEWLGDHGCCRNEGILGRVRVRGKILKCNISESCSLVHPASNWQREQGALFWGSWPGWEPKEPALEPGKSSPFPGLSLLIC